MSRFGLRAHDFGCLPVRELAQEIARFSPSCVQLAPPKALSDFPESRGCPAVEEARAIAGAFAERGISIAVLGCYINPVHPDPEKRNAQLSRFEEYLRRAGDFGCRIVGTETGSLNPDSSAHPGTGDASVFDEFCASAERLARVAEDFGVMIGVEPVADQHTISSIEKARTMISRLGSPSIGIIYDPVNLIPSAGLDESQADFFARAFDAFGDRIVAIHLKDFRFEKGGKIGNLPAGRGDMDYSAFFRILGRERMKFPMLLENTSRETARGALEALERAAP